MVKIKIKNFKEKKEGLQKFDFLQYVETKCNLVNCAMTGKPQAKMKAFNDNDVFGPAWVPRLVPQKKS